MKSIHWLLERLSGPTKGRISHEFNKTASPKELSKIGRQNRIEHWTGGGSQEFGSSPSLAI